MPISLDVMPSLLSYKKFTDDLMSIDTFLDGTLVSILTKHTAFTGDLIVVCDYFMVLYTMNLVALNIYNGCSKYK